MVDTDKEILQSILDKENWKQVDFCAATDIDRTTVSRVATGRKKFPKKVLPQLKQQFTYANIQLDLKPPAWLEKDFQTLADNVHLIPEYAVRLLREQIASTISVHAKPKKSDGHGDNIFLDWGFFTSDLLASLEQFFNGVFLYNSISVIRMENPFDANSRYLASTSGRGQTDRRLIKALYDRNPSEYMREQFIWNRGAENSWYRPNPWIESLMVIPVLLLSGRGVVVGIESKTAIFQPDDLEIAKAHIKNFFDQRNIPIIEDTEYQPHITYCGCTACFSSQ
tara:strand:- start:75 stop:917 length:843 start_codon:yes stop_codon:yes gene_type:complete